jgi:hypothetical protein
MIPKDKNGKKVETGHVIITDEGGWIGEAVVCKDYILLFGEDGGFSSEPCWEKCEIISKLSEEEQKERWYNKGKPDPFMGKL